MPMLYSVYNIPEGCEAVSRRGWGHWSASYTPHNAAAGRSECAIVSPAPSPMTTAPPETWHQNLIHTAPATTECWLPLATTGEPQTTGNEPLSTVHVYRERFSSLQRQYHGHYRKVRIIGAMATIELLVQCVLCSVLHQRLLCDVPLWSSE